MSNTWDTSALDALAQKPVSAARSGPAPWEPLDVSTLAPGRYLACDQSLNATGLVWFEVYDGGPRPFVKRAISFGNDLSDLATVEHTMSAAEEVAHRFEKVLDDWLLPMQMYAVHETPPAAGRMARPESSMLAALGFRLAVGRRGFIRLPMVQANAHKILITGDKTAKKSAVKLALQQYVYPHIDGVDRITNEAHRDALCVALAAAKARKA